MWCGVVCGMWCVVYVKIFKHTPIGRKENESIRLCYRCVSRFIRIKTDVVVSKTKPQSMQKVLHYTQSSPVSLKVLLCVLFVFFNRAHRVIRNKSTLTDTFDLVGFALIPLLISLLVHTILMCPGIFVPPRGGRMQVIFAILHVLLLHSVAALLISMTLNRYITTSGFLSVSIASHFCFSIRPLQPNLIQSQKILYGCVTKLAAYVLPVLCWILLPVLRIHELEAIVLIFIPEALCFVFAHCLHFATLLLNVAVLSACSVIGVAGGEY